MLGAAILLPALAAAQTATDAWTVAGRQGIILQVIVPAAQARNMDAYRQQIEMLCAGKETCFANFFTNSTGAELAIPLPDAITQEATAVLRRSGKNGVEGFRWSCRMAMPEPGCF
jgi:hypothetical protein